VCGGGLTFEAFCRRDFGHNLLVHTQAIQTTERLFYFGVRRTRKLFETGATWARANLPDSRGASSRRKARQVVKQTKYRGHRTRTACLTIARLTVGALRAAICASGGESANYRSAINANAHFAHTEAMGVLCT
jgi:hypothetical protein